MIFIIHENKEWLSPFQAALEDVGAAYTFWYVPEMNINLMDVPPEGVFYNRMSASSHSRNHRYEPELALGILECNAITAKLSTAQEHWTWKLVK